MTRADVREVLDRIAYKGWAFVLGQDEDGALWVQVSFMAPDDPTDPAGLWEVQKGRKWRLSEHMTPSEVVGTAFKACLTAEEHEAREAFRYRGAPIYGPHFDVEALVELAERPHVHDVRSPA